jgi:hypothetical protein
MGRRLDNIMAEPVQSKAKYLWNKGEHLGVQYKLYGRAQCRRRRTMQGWNLLLVRIFEITRHGFGYIC